MLQDLPVSEEEEAVMENWVRRFVIWLRDHDKCQSGERLENKSG